MRSDQKKPKPSGLNRLKPLQITKSKPGDLLSDGGGLYLVCGKGNGKTKPKAWAFYYFKDKKRRELGLGSLEDLTLEAARALAAKLRAAHASGVDPEDERDRLWTEAEAAATPAPAAAMFRDVAADYIKSKRDGWRNPKHLAQWTSTLERYAYPTIGDTPVADVDETAVLKVLQPIWSTKPETAARVRGRIEAVLGYAAYLKLRTGANPAIWRDGLAHALPPRGKVKAVKHHRALRHADLPTFMRALSEQDGIAALAVRFAVLTAARTGEVIGARWAEVDLEAATWTIPGTRMKAGKDHRVALNGPAVEILRTLAESRVSAYVFPGAQRDKPLSNMAMLETLRRMKMEDGTTMNDRTTVHGLRSTFRDWCAEQTSAPHDVVEACLAHTTDSGVVRAYRRTDFFDKRRDLMETWGRFATGAVESNVVPLRASA